MSGSASTPSTSKQQELAALFDKTFLEMLPRSFAKIYNNFDIHSRMFRSVKLEQAVKKLQTLNFFEIPDQAHRKLIQDVSDLKAFLGSVSQQKDWAPTKIVYTTFDLIFAYLNIGNLLDYYELTLENLTLFSISSEQRWSMLLADNARNPAGLFETLKAFGQECKKRELHQAALAEKRRVQLAQRLAGTQSVPVSDSLSPKKITIGFGNDTPIHTPSVTNLFLSRLSQKETERAISAPVGKPSEKQIAPIPRTAAFTSTETVELREDDFIWAKLADSTTANASPSTKTSKPEADKDIFDDVTDILLSEDDSEKETDLEESDTTPQQNITPSPLPFHTAFLTQAEKKPAEVSAALAIANAKLKKKPAPEAGVEEPVVGSPWHFS